MGSTAEDIIERTSLDYHIRENIEDRQRLAFSRQSNLQKLPIRIQPILKEATFGKDESTFRSAWHR
jgi:hypothetical protein